MDWFLGLSQRERVMVLACAAVVLMALIWVMAVQPVVTHVAQLEQRVESKETQLSNYQELATVAGARPKGSTRTVNKGRGESTVVIIDRTTRERQLAGYLKRNQPEGDNSVRVRFEGAPFDILVAWIGELNQSYGMNTSSANFDDAGPGRVNVNLVLNRQGN